ncbi:polysaccharide/polyol phosphate ABC transporter ATPase [Flavobacterium limnosediminis JC2902]|uniref:Polysaccharide/polyol phosphate ABC transporter ATPase n=1 Tax=Flavobacterium limnosediminis JC2902 TaxID=1341181 RepID=V6SI74_9FLAO|nr:ABC transporter ATP-binding protein [Flavobacterium limnosediminis]ESU25972.1 polysaccharide/polyol phosphate ABC transporter ATPase [Flavobacterium limnosediminis JC2902]
MSKVVIKAEDISKQYRLGLVGTGTVKDDMKRWWYNLRGKEDPFLKIGEANDRSVKGESDYVWSLRDINFEIHQGDSVGIIGRNGAGKSTLLKILSQVTQPTTGKIYTKGRIASLLEVGTGFHPEMTGRQNIFLNGAILGMRKHEIQRKLDEIIAFSGVERYIDTPVKRYSSGMYVRLAFAVAAHLESEILIVDEVLAVGDAEFQKKCLGKMNDVSKGEGRTVLFVSHNMAAVKSLCTKGIVLENGKVVFGSDAESAVNYYLTNASQVKDTSIADRTDRIGSGAIKVIGIDLINQKGEIVDQVISGDWLKVRLNLNINLGVIDYSKLFVGIALRDQEETRVVSFFSDEMGTDFTKFKDKDYIDLVIPQFNLRGGMYDVAFQLSLGSTRVDDFIDGLEKAMNIDVLPGDFWKSGKLNRTGNYAILTSNFEN